MSNEINVWFHINVPVANSKRIIGVPITHFYSSPQVERFRVKGSKRVIVLEKQVSKPRQPWKIIDGNANDSQAVLDTLEIIQWGIDRYLEMNKGPRLNEGYFNMGAPKI